MDCKRVSKKLFEGYQIFAFPFLQLPQWMKSYRPLVTSEDASLATSYPFRPWQFQYLAALRAGHH